jgi:hypothetical protein
MDSGLCQVAVRSKKKGSSSFLKKRTKKLLLVWLRWLGELVRPAFAFRSKSFLVLFFKKELLPS